MSLPEHHHHGSGGDTADQKTMDMTMQSSFYWGTDVVILFSGWPDHHSFVMYLLALFFVFVLAVVVEVISVPGAGKAGGSSSILLQLLDVGVYAVRVGLGYLVMLAVMSFNVGVFMAAVVGHVVGFFIVKTSSFAAKPIQEEPHV
ncbi:hypothetical protein UlMin_000372 [Ulmus minor]